MVSPFFEIKLKKEKLLVLFAATILITAVGKDLLLAEIKDYSFYLSESILFETFWLLFIPILIWLKPFVTSFAKQNNILIITFLSISHIVLFSIWVFSISLLFFTHTFRFSWLILDTSLDHGVSCLLIYGMAVLIFQKRKPIPSETENKRPSEKIMVTHRNRKILVDIGCILYVRSETPYVALITGTNTYLYNSSLKAFMQEKASDQFIRIHKSTIVNIGFVTSYRSRHNGDYDVVLNNGTVLRLSRNFSKQFKSAFS